MSLNPPQDYRKTIFTHRRGLIADRPAATDVLPGTLYYSTDIEVIDQSDGANWFSYSGTIPAGPFGDVFTNVANVFTENQTVDKTLPRVILNDSAGAVNARKWDMVANAGNLYFEALDDAFTTAYATFALARNGDLVVPNHITAAGNYYEAGRAAAQGNWTDITFNSSNFYASGMTWTIAAGNLAVNNYTMIGKTLIWNVVESGSTLAAPLGNALTMYFPASAISSHYVHIPILLYNTTVWFTGVGVVNPGSPGMVLYKNDKSNYTAGALNLAFQIMVPII